MRLPFPHWQRIKRVHVTYYSSRKMSANVEHTFQSLFLSSQRQRTIPPGFQIQILRRRMQGDYGVQRDTSLTLRYLLSYICSGLPIIWKHDYAIIFFNRRNMYALPLLLSLFQLCRGFAGQDLSTGPDSTDLFELSLIHLNDFHARWATQFDS